MQNKTNKKKTTLYIHRTFRIAFNHLSTLKSLNSAIVLCGINKKTKIKSSRLADKNITERKSRYFLFINIEYGDKTTGSKYRNLKQKLYYSLSIKLIR